VRVLGDDRLDSATIEPVDEIIALQQRCRRDHHGAEPDHRKHCLAEGHNIAEHYQHPVAGPDPKAAEEVRDLPRASRELGEGQHFVVSGVVDDPERRPSVPRGHAVEVVSHPVKVGRRRPVERGVRARRCGGQQRVAKLQKRRLYLPLYMGDHRCSGFGD
jgi:hypothetical protein